MLKESFLEILSKRYSCKAMNKETVDDEVIERILEAIRLSPTSSGLQPFEVFVVTNQDIKDQIRKVAWNQSTVSDCSHLLVFAAWGTYSEERINYMFDLTNEIREMKNEGWEKYRQMLLSVYPQQDPEVSFQHAARQAYIALMSAMTQVQIEGLDAVPMEGFEPKDVDRILDLGSQDLRSCVLLPIGHRDSEKDWLVSLKKVRKPMDKLAQFIK